MTRRPAATPAAARQTVKGAQASLARRGAPGRPAGVSTAVAAPDGPQTLILDNFPSPTLARQLSPNGRAHWAQRKRARDTVEGIVGYAIFEQRLSDSLLGGPVRITYRWVMPDRRRRDLDNHSTGVVKVVQDCLVRLGLIDADDTSCIRAISVEVVVERGRRALEITLEALAHDDRAEGG